MSQESLDEFKKLIDLIFMGREPKFLSMISGEHFLELSKRLDAQNARSVQDIKYVRLLQDIGQVLTPTFNPLFDSKQLHPEDFSDMQIQTRMVIATMYLTAIDNPDNSIQNKIDTGYLLKKFLITIKEIYSIDMINDQELFIQNINKNEEELLLALADYQELMTVIEKNEDYIGWDDNFCKEWCYTEKQLSDLSHQLFRSGFTEDEQAFYQVFLKKLDKTCEWKKSKTSLIFLFQMLYENRFEFPDPMLKFVQDRFTFKGKPTEVRNLNVQSEQISSHYNQKREFLKGNYLAIYNIHNSVFKREK